MIGTGAAPPPVRAPYRYQVYLMGASVGVQQRGDMVRLRLDVNTEEGATCSWRSMTRPQLRESDRGGRPGRAGAAEPAAEPAAALEGRGRDAEDERRSGARERGTW